MSALVHRAYERHGLARLLVVVRALTVIVLAALLVGATLSASALERAGLLSEGQAILATLAAVGVCALLALLIGRTVIAPVARMQTDRLREALAQERQARRDLERELQLRQVFIEQANHHLRTPVTVVFGLAELLADRGDELEARDRQRMRQVMLAHAGRLKGIVESLSGFLDEQVSAAAGGSPSLSDGPQRRG